MPTERRQRSEVNRPPIADDRTSTPAEVSVEAIRDRAYELYEARGGEPGHDFDDWLQAERELRPTRAV